MGSGMRQQAASPVAKRTATGRAAAAKTGSTALATGTVTCVVCFVFLMSLFFQGGSNSQSFICTGIAVTLAAMSVDSLIRATTIWNAGALRISACCPQANAGSGTAQWIGTGSTDPAGTTRTTASPAAAAPLCGTPTSPALTAGAACLSGRPGCPAECVEVICQNSGRINSL